MEGSVLHHTSIRSYAADASSNDPPLDETYYWYDRRGLLIKASNLAALVELERDGNGRIIRETTNGRSIESKLDARGNRIECRIGRGEPGEGFVAIGRDPLGMVASIAIDDHAPLVFTRDALGRETSRTSAKGFRLEQSFDAVGQLLHQRVGSGVAERRYGWDKAGAPTSIDDAIWGETRYTYDVNGQVAKAEFGDGFTEKFTYDSGGNYTSPIGVTYEERALPPGSKSKPYHKYKVLKETPVTKSTAAPWFGEPGGGTQYLHPESMDSLLKSGTIEEIP